ncbi:hypothetical protein A4A49_57979 [Nicotiana attenuata]|uniref:Uncharacterized protein n=1 Tax=Nicotiana attenuata TaxID=49451 RepID=A0A1J6JMZ5_NICAT|nr:hypothetical protein A4A49_57979 [Nicotiana attenuata]
MLLLNLLSLIILQGFREHKYGCLRATKILAEMRNTLALIVVLCINSPKDGSKEHENLWVAFKYDISHSNQLRCFLSSDDLDGLEQFIQDLASKHIISHMEQKFVFSITKCKTINYIHDESFSNIQVH